MASPKNALILYNFNSYDKVSDVESQHLDTLARLGCSGRMHLEKIPEGSSRLNDIKQLLGLSGSTEPAEMKQTLLDRFGKMRLGLISSSTTVIDMAKGAGLAWTELWRTEQSQPTINQLIQSGYQNMENGLLDCLLVDMTCDQHQALSWNWSNHILGDALTNQPAVLKCVVTRYPCEQKQQQSGWWTDLTPPQSYEFKNGHRIEAQHGVKYIGAYFHAETTRADLVDCFDLDKMDQLGCNGSILAWHYLAEIGHKLGYVPKYGA